MSLFWMVLFLMVDQGTYLKNKMLQQKMLVVTSVTAVKKLGPHWWEKPNCEGTLTLKKDNNVLFGSFEQH